jgi:hypothetical protein
LYRGIPFEYDRTVNYAPPGTDSGTIVWKPRHSLATLENKALFVQGFYDSLLHFLECVLNKSAAKLGTLEFARDIMKVYEGALLSEGQSVEIEGNDALPGEG